MRDLSEGLCQKGIARCFMLIAFVTQPSRKTWRSYEFAMLGGTVGKGIIVAQAHNTKIYKNHDDTSDSIDVKGTGLNYKISHARTDLTA